MCLSLSLPLPICLLQNVSSFSFLFFCFYLDFLNPHVGMSPLAGRLRWYFLLYLHLGHPIPTPTPKRKNVAVEKTEPESEEGIPGVKSFSVTAQLLRRTFGQFYWTSAAN